MRGAQARMPVPRGKAFEVSRGTRFSHGPGLWPECLDLPRRYFDRLKQAPKALLRPVFFVQQENFRDLFHVAHSGERYSFVFIVYQALKSDLLDLRTGGAGRQFHRGANPFIARDGVIVMAKMRAEPALFAA